MSCFAALKWKKLKFWLWIEKKEIIKIFIFILQKPGVENPTKPAYYYLITAYYYLIIVFKKHKNGLMIDDFSQKPLLKD